MFKSELSFSMVSLVKISTVSICSFYEIFHSKYVLSETIGSEETLLGEAIIF